jgi:RNA polymerase sigma-70 factor (ECF subfamily)
MRGQDDATLLARVASGDLTALGELFDRYHLRVRRVLHRAGTADADLDDLVQATFLQLPKIARGFDGRASCAAWLCGIAVRLAARRQRSVARMLAAFAAFARSRASNTSDPEATASSREELTRFREALAGLSARKRDAFILVELEGFSAEEAGHALGIPSATVRTRVFHARAELRAAVKTWRAT